MSWINNFQLFLFDFDGLLVNTEELHFAAYKAMCKRRGYDLDWSLDRFFGEAHFDSTALRDAIYAQFPKLKQEEPRWEVLYAEKKAAYMEILQDGNLKLMPGVDKLLKRLEKAQIKRCVVTNSTKGQIDFIKGALPELKSIPYWIMREDYTHPKPDPECYLKAVAKYGKKGDRIIGFEDSMRGFTALEGAGVKGVLICPLWHPQLKRVAKEKFVHFTSFEEIPENFSIN